MNGDKGDSHKPNPNAEPGGGGSGEDARLRAVEDRLTQLETRREYMAAKEDLQNLKIWVLGGVLGSIVAAIFAVVSIVLLVIRVFS